MSELKETKEQKKPELSTKQEIKSSSEEVVAVPSSHAKDNAKKTKSAMKKKTSAVSSEKTEKKSVPEIKKIKESLQETKTPDIPPVLTEQTEQKKNAIVLLSAPTQEQPSGVVVYIGREDAQAQQLRDAVYEAVRAVWTPPPGFGQVCARVEIILNWDGTIQKCTLAQSSGVPLFDACVRRDSKKIMFPRGAWGKTWILTFSNDTKVTYE